MAEAQVSLDVSELKENFLECSVCLEHFDQAERRPRLLVNCLHSFCSQCLEQLLEKEGRGQITCPNCRQVQKVKGKAQSLPIDPVRNKLVDYVQFKIGKNIPCTDCPEGSHAVARCHECQSYMCTPCKEAHHRNRSTRKHTCQSLKEALSEPVKNFMSHHCKDHPDYKIEFYCRHCFSLCCVSCSIWSHKGHDLVPIDDAANSMLSSLKTQIDDVKRSTSVLRRKKTSLEQKSKLQEVTLINTTDSINKNFDELIGKLNCQRNKLITELMERTESTMTGLKKQREATEDSLAQMESTLEYFKQMESKSDDCEVLSAGPVLVQSLKAAATVDLTEDVQDPTWTFSPGEMDSVISRFGGIHSDTKRHMSQEKASKTDEEKHPSTSSKEGKKDTDYFRGKTITVRVYKADITKLDVDVIVNGANGRLSHGGGVAKAIADAAGPSLTREGNALVDKFGQIAVTDLAVTNAGNLPCKKVFHAVGPQKWSTRSTTKQDQCQTDLCLTILRCLCEAENMKMRSIAIPSISAAIFRVPKNLCARAYVRALKIFDEVSGAAHLKEVHFIDISDTMVEEILAACGATWNIPVDVSQYDTEREFMNMYLGNTKKSSSKVSKSSEPTDTLSLVDFFSGHPFTKPADAIVSWENFGSYQSTISFFYNDGGKDFEEGRRKALNKCHTFGDVEIGPGGHLPVKHVVYTKVATAIKSNELLDYLRKLLNKTASSESLVLPVLKDLDKQGIGKDWKMTFVECLVQALQEYSKSNPVRRKILIFAESSTDMLDVQTRFKEHVNALSLKQLEEDCSICLEAITKPSKLKCGHVFCEGCIKDALKVKQACPICKTVCGVITGNMPSGTMDVKDYGPTLPGFERYRTITIHYNFPDGTQRSHHPHPGKPYRGTKRTAYLPASPEGYEILKLLKIAWDRKLTFTVGRSVTIDDEMDRVTWNEIHHKTKATGGETNHGYPDPGYLKRVREELAAQGVTLDELGATGTHV